MLATHKRVVAIRGLVAAPTRMHNVKLVRVARTYAARLLADNDFYWFRDRVGLFSNLNADETVMLNSLDTANDSASDDDEVDAVTVTTKRTIVSSRPVSAGCIQ